MTRDRRLAVDRRQRLSAGSRQRLWAFGPRKRRWCGRRGRRWYRLRCTRNRLTRDRRLAVDWRQRLSAGSRQGLRAFGSWKRCWGGRWSRRRYRLRYSRLCRCGSRRRLTGDGRLAICRWRSCGLGLIVRRSGWRSRVLNRDRFWRDRWRKRGREQSSSAGSGNAGTYNTGAGGRWFGCRGRLRLRCWRLSRRGESLALPARIGNYNGIGSVIDDNGVVNVVVDDVIWRRRNVVRRVDIDRYRSINRNWKNVGIYRRWWRRQLHEVDRSRRQEKHRRWWWRLKSKIRIVENQYRALDVDHLFRRRRRYVVADDFESRRRFEGCRQICKAAPRIVGMGAAGVAAQIGPVRRRRIDASAAPPRRRLAPRGNNRPHAPCHRIVRISDQEVFIVLQIVAIESSEIGIPGVKITDRLGSDR